MDPDELFPVTLGVCEAQFKLKLNSEEKLNYHWHRYRNR